MVDYLINNSNITNSKFQLDITDDFINYLEQSEEPKIMFGVTFALLDLVEKGVKPKNGIVEAFRKKVTTFKPDLILVSVLESTYYLAKTCLKQFLKKTEHIKLFLEEYLQLMQQIKLLRMILLIMFVEVRVKVLLLKWQMHLVLVAELIKLRIVL